MPKKTTKKQTSLKPVLVTTEFRGIFFGYVKEDKKLPLEIILTGARNCIYWSANVGGFLGLATIGPNKDCRIGKRVEQPFKVFKITSVTEVTDDAVKAWENA